MDAQIPDGSKDRPYDVLIIGAGVVGSAAAVAFSRQSRSVLLIERSLKEPDRIVGELLQPGGVAALEKLGMKSCLDDIHAVPVTGYEIFYRGESITFFYPPVEVAASFESSQEPEKGTSTTERPEGRSFHYGKFVMQLRKAAASEENLKVVEAVAKELLTDEERVVGVKCLASGKERTFFAHLTIVVDGQGSNFRSQSHNRKPISRSRFWALELIDAELPYYGRAYGVIGSGPPVLIYQIGTHETRILIDIPDSIHETDPTTHGTKEYVRACVLPTLPKSVHPMVQTALKEGRLRSMPNSWLPADLRMTAGLLTLGDAMNIRHPLTGGGMTVGLKDVVTVSQLLSPQIVPSLEDTVVVLKQTKEFYSQRKAYSMSLNVLAQALYTLFLADDPQLQILQRGFIHYIKTGGASVEEAAGLMGGVVNSPWLLFYQFSLVALSSLRIFLHDSCADSMWYLPGALVECVRVIVKACRVILPFIFIELWG